MEVLHNLVQRCRNIHAAAHMSQTTVQCLDTLCVIVHLTDHCLDTLCVIVHVIDHCVDAFLDQSSHQEPLYGIEMEIPFCPGYYVAVPLTGLWTIFGARVMRDCPSCGRTPRDIGWPSSGMGEPVAENRFAGHPYLDLFRCRSMSHRRENAFPQVGQRWVPL